MERVERRRWKEQQVQRSPADGARCVPGPVRRTPWLEHGERRTPDGRGNERSNPITEGRVSHAGSQQVCALISLQERTCRKEYSQLTASKSSAYGVSWYLN